MEHFMLILLVVFLTGRHDMLTTCYPISYQRELRKLELLERLLQSAEAELDARENDYEQFERRELSDEQSALLHRQQRVEPSVTEFLEKFGYLHKLADETHQHDPSSRSQAIKNFQRMYHLKPTGILDEQTVKAITAARCGMPDMVPMAIVNDTHFNSVPNDLKPENYVVPGYVWNRKQLSWKLRNYLNSVELTQSTQKQAIRSAFQLWTEVTQLDFTESGGDKGDINLEFAWGDHGDGPQNAFNGPGGVLAHAFYPDSGELHYDSSEQWTDGKNAGINLRIVTAHELGHALGLGHSKVQGALMAPYYQGYDANFKLPQDDIDAIQSLYGSRSGAVNPPVNPPVNPQVPATQSPKPTQKPPKPEMTTVVPVQPGGAPDSCTVQFRATTQTHDNRVYVYNGKWMWRLSEYGLDSGFPALISSSYETPPDSVDAAIFTKTHYYTYFFRGNKLWTYYGFQLVNKKTITTPGYPTNPQEALVATDGTIYLVKDGNCTPFDEDHMDITGGTTRTCSSIFPGAPATFDSALRLVDEPSFIYFFQGKNYFKYSETSKQVLPGYPKAKAGPWMGPACGAAPYTPR